MQTFAFTVCPEFQALLEVEIKEITGNRPIIRTSLEELRSLLAIFSTIELLIVDLPEDVEAAYLVRDFIVSSRDRIKKCLVLGNENAEQDHIRLYNRIEISELFEGVRTLYNPTEVPKVGWTAVPLCTLVHFQSLPFDLYIKLSDNRYVKRIPAFEDVDKDVIENLRSKNINELFCEKKHNRDFSMMLINNMINKVERSYTSINQKLRANEEVFETTKEIIQNLGLSGRVIEVCETAIERMCMDVLTAPNEFSSYLLTLKKDKSLAFQYRLITLTNYIGVQLITEMDLPKLDEQVRKFVMASYFCDITLKNPGHLYHRKADDVHALDLEEQNEVNFHALKASELITTLNDTPKEVAIIIRQHHGSFSGIGFPVEKSSQLLPLAKILFVSQELAFAILQDEETPAMDILRRFLKKNRCTGLQELLNCLEDSVTKIAS